MKTLNNNRSIIKDYKDVLNYLLKFGFIKHNKNVDIKISVHFWNNLHQVHSNQKIGILVRIYSKTQFLVRLQFPSSCKTKHFLFPRLVQIKFIFSDNVHVYIVYIFSFYNESLKLQFLSLVFKLPILWKSIFLFVYRSFVCLL